MDGMSLEAAFEIVFAVGVVVAAAALAGAAFEQVGRRALIGAAAAIGVGAVAAWVAFAFQPSTGLQLSVTSFNIVIIGGMGSLLGAFVGGLLVSLAESMGAVFLAPSMKELVSFSLLIVILLVRPAGLFGKRA